MDYADLVGVYEALESTTKRLEKTKIISGFLTKVKDNELAIIVLLIQGKVFPQTSEQKIGIASKLVVRSISKSSGMTLKKVEEEWKKTGDLGLTSQNLLSKKTQATLISNSLTVEKVHNNIKKLATLQGEGSVDQKISLVSELLTSAKPIEGRYIVRTLLEDLRVGVGEGTLRDAIVWAYFSDKVKFEIKEGKLETPDRDEYNKYINAVQFSYDTTNDFGVVAKIAKTKGLKGLLSLDLEVGNPVKVMLAIKVNDAKEGLERVGSPLQAEFKLDGFRLQIHKDKNGIKLFTRRLEDVTKQFPDVVRQVKQNVKGNSFILDTEAVGYSPETKKYLPFQKISQRIKRKYHINEVSKKFPVEVNVFDILYFNGKSMINESLSKRSALLGKIIDSKTREIVNVEKGIFSDAGKIGNFFDKSILAGCEGLMLKKLDAPYKPGARVGHMVKLKESMENLDLVIIGAEWGEGKRTKWLSSYFLACIDSDGNLLEIGRVSTGLKEKEEGGLSFSQMTKLLKPLIICEKGREVRVKSEIVIEVCYEEIQKSTNYDSGFALRFPRVIRLREGERSASDITTVEYVEELFYGQNK